MFTGNKILDQLLGASPKTCFFASIFIVFLPFSHICFEKHEKAFFYQRLK